MALGEQGFYVLTRIPVLETRQPGILATVSSVKIRIPMITTGPVTPSQIVREFQGGLPTVGAIGFVASIIREGLESVDYPDFRNLTALSDDYLVQQANLARAVPNDAWIRNGLYPLSDWEQAF